MDSDVRVIIEYLFSYSYDLLCFFFFFNDTATTEIYTLSLHDASSDLGQPHDERAVRNPARAKRQARHLRPRLQDRKSTRLNSSHMSISYAVFCLKKKKQIIHKTTRKKKKKTEKTRT